MSTRSGAARSRSTARSTALVGRARTGIRGEAIAGTGSLGVASGEAPARPACAVRNGPGPRHGRSLLRRADGLMAQAYAADVPEERFRAAYLAALRGAGALVDASSTGRRGAAGGAWVALARAVPEFSGWASWFADHSALRTGVDAGVRTVTSEAATEFFDETARFLHDVEAELDRGSAPEPAARRPA